MVDGRADTLCTYVLYIFLLVYGNVFPVTIRCCFSVGDISNVVFWLQVQRSRDVCFPTPALLVRLPHSPGLSLTTCLPRPSSQCFLLLTMHRT